VTAGSLYRSAVPVTDCLDLAAATPICRSLFAERAARARLPSLAWGLVLDGKVVAGDDADAVYRIASMTKSFTAASVLMLRDDGRLRLDDVVVEHAPELAALRFPAPDAPAITIRHLLSMSSGLATDDAWADRHLDITDDELDALIDSGVGFATVPGTAFEYSNLGYAVLGRVVRNVAGAPLQQLVADRLLRPLGMDRTTWTAPRDARAGFRSRSSDDDVLRSEPSLADGAMAPMGGLFSTVSDLARWIGFLASSFAGAPTHADVLAAASRREMQQVARAFSPTFATNNRQWSQRSGGYGFGLNVIPHARLGATVTHSGGLPGFGSNMRWVPATGVGLVALANSTYAPMQEATSVVLDALAEAGAVSAAYPTISAAVEWAARGLADLIASWDDSAAGALFADNVALDEPLSDRRSAAQQLAAEHGPLTLARIVAESATAAVVVLHGRTAELHVDFQLAPTGAVQSYGVDVVA
jgi:CubicO group peptidase (beta-lactamase class C family)